MSGPHRAAFEWGLASVILGVPLAFMAPVAALCTTDITNVCADTQFLQRPAAYALCTLPAGMILLSFGGVVAGARSVMLSRASGRPIAIGLAGAALCLAASAFWSVTALLWYVGACMESPVMRACGA